MFSLPRLAIRTDKRNGRTGAGRGIESIELEVAHMPGYEGRVGFDHAGDVVEADALDRGIRGALQPDWLLPLLPDGGQDSDRKSSVELDVAPNAQSAATAKKETVPHSTVAAKKEMVPYSTVTAHPYTGRMYGLFDSFRYAKGGSTLFRPKQEQSDTGTATVRRVR